MMQKGLKLPELRNFYLKKTQVPSQGLFASSSCASSRHFPLEEIQSPWNVIVLRNIKVDKKQFLSELLPYNAAEKTGERLIDGLREYLLLLTMAEDAMQSLQKGEFYFFDPLVGENACQIRAVKIALILQESAVEVERILNAISSSREKIREFLKSGAAFLDEKMSLEDFLHKEEVDLPVTDDELFLIKSFILTKTKIVRPFFKSDRPLVENAYTDSKKIKETGEVGSSFSCELVKSLRKRLSARSASFVQELAGKLDIVDTSSELVTEEFSTVHNGLKCLPYYWATRVLMLQALKYQIPIAMVARQLARDKEYQVVENAMIYFKPTPNGYREVPMDELDPEKAAMVLIGSTCRDSSELPSLDVWRKELLEQSPIDLVLAYAAAHRQYPDESKDQVLKDIRDENYEYHRKKAEEWGCSLENPSRFFLTHAFCDKIKNASQHA